MAGLEEAVDESGVEFEFPCEGVGRGEGCEDDAFGTLELRMPAFEPRFEVVEG